MTEWMIYGVSGYTGRLCAEEAVLRGMRPVVAGRNRPGGVAALVGPPGNAALRDTDCSILVCEPHNVL